MANPYTSVTVANFNLNPPADDGTVAPENKLNWSKHKTKLADPLKTAIESTQTNLATAFGKIVGGAGVTSSAISYEVVAGDQGKLVRASDAGVTITTPSATAVGSPFVFAVVNDSDGDITVDGNGSQTINSAASITLGVGRGALFWTDGTNWFAIGYTSEVRPLPFTTPRGRLTLSTGVAVLASDVTAAATVYFTPHQGNTVMLPDANGNWAMYQFAELSQALSDNTKSPAAAAADSLYDMFVWDDAGTLRCTRGPAWTSATGRGTGAGTTEIELLSGVYVNAVAISNGPGANRGVYVGTIATDGSTQLNMMFAPAAAAGGSANRLDVWNMYNRVDVGSINRDSTDSWNDAAAAWRAKGNSTSNRFTFVRGLNEDCIAVINSVLMTEGATSAISGVVGIGLDAVDAIAAGSTTGAHGTSLATALAQITAHYNGVPGLGRHFVQAIEYEVEGTVVWYGDNGAATIYQSGMSLRTRM